MSKLHFIGPPQGERKRADVVFVHGLGGHPLETWRHLENTEKNSWPFWLADEGIGVDVHSLEYEASPSDWIGASMPLLDRSKSTLAHLTSEGIGRYSIIFIAHSLGGLLVKQMLRHAWESDDERWRQVWDKCRGVVFLATPHSGSALPVWLGRLGGIFRLSPNTKELAAHNPMLRDLNQWYRKKAPRKRIETLAFGETRPMKGLGDLVVDQTSADADVSDLILLPADHESICKPRSTTERPYVEVLQFVDRCAGRSPSENGAPRPSETPRPQPSQASAPVPASNQAERGSFSSIRPRPRSVDPSQAARDYYQMTAGERKVYLVLLALSVMVLLGSPAFLVISETVSAARLAPFPMGALGSIFFLSSQLKGLNRRSKELGREQENA